VVELVNQDWDLVVFSRFAHLLPPFWFPPPTLFVMLALDRVMGDLDISQIRFLILI
jgi:hypothetical protein